MNSEELVVKRKGEISQVEELVRDQEPTERNVNG